MAKLKKLLRRAAEIVHLPLPASSPAVRPLVAPTDLVEEYIRAWDAKDADAIGRLFVEDADFVNVVGLWWTGRRSIVKAQRFGFQNAFANATIRLSKVSQRLLGDDAAVVMAQWQISGQVDPDRQPVEPRRGVIQATLVKLDDGTWLGVSCTNTDMAMAADTFVSREGRLTATSYIKGPTAQELAAAEDGPTF
ncbi:SgcJ/EcaC family oxidoreductase [Micropruina sonneratiae]|uniref:SgcJ/EcaC family oxidoreductase n=1 Tax=Micropruina sonneratiae TaxID=2986940 RepID=UPI0022267E3D|nr:SgcJ/EcaC family oxidoreductase [Micropruina sp. KQZ13P-5]MCW3157598.1 SgcJ/EcaC family oxidoreductase [Micropruina sp. KQZ13P-5]